LSQSYWKILINSSCEDLEMTSMDESQTKMYKVSDIIAHLLALNGVKTVFGVSGGASLHLLHGVHEHQNLNLITTHHEQAAAMAADSTARITGEIGAAISTSGPGATNLITGIAGCYYDSIPTIFITGQVSTNRLGQKFGVRQLGFQETPIVDMVSKVTKYAVQVLDPNRVIEEFEKCVKLAISGRPGPTLIDIPDDIQRMEINLPNGLPTQRVVADLVGKENSLSTSELNTLIDLVASSKRPVVVLGWGVHLSGQEEVICKFLDKLNWPTLLTWGAADILPDECPYRIGTFGTHGNRDANLIIQNSDLILSIGSRLDTKSTGSPVTSFATEAKRIMIDLDANEIDKFTSLGWQIDLSLNINLRSREFLKLMDTVIQHANPLDPNWILFIEESRQLFRRKIDSNDDSYVDPYQLIETLSQLASPSTRVIVDTGCSIAWVAQAWKFKSNQRLFHDFNNTAMGWALPAAIASIAVDDLSETIAIIGDGSFMMSMQELATLANQKKPLRLFIINNSGYSMIKQTQDQWFGSAYFASNSGDSLLFPDFEQLSRAFNIKYLKVDGASELQIVIARALEVTESILCEIQVSPLARVIPQVKFGSSIESMEPEVPTELLHSVRKTYNSRIED
jgi:acetolactate synthase-1/2/3 large subunit